MISLATCIYAYVDSFYSPIEDCFIKWRCFHTIITKIHKCTVYNTMCSITRKLHLLYSLTAVTVLNIWCLKIPWLLVSLYCTNLGWRKRKFCSPYWMECWSLWSILSWRQGNVKMDGRYLISEKSMQFSCRGNRFPARDCTQATACKAKSKLVGMSNAVKSWTCEKELG